MNTLTTVANVDVDPQRETTKLDWPGLASWIS
jgi:hypothetical protein